MASAGEGNDNARGGNNSGRPGGGGGAGQQAGQQQQRIQFTVPLRQLRHSEGLSIRVNMPGQPPQVCFPPPPPPPYSNEQDAVLHTEGGVQ